MEPVYLDHAATTPLDGRVLAAMLPHLAQRWGNPSSLHRAGRDALAAVDEARAEVAAWLGGREREVLFTSGGTEADNLAVRGVLLARRGEGRDVLVVSAVEHEAVAHTARSLAAQAGVEVRVAPVDAAGRIDLSALARLVDGRTALVCVMLAQNETGAIHDVMGVVGIAHAQGALVHTDAVAAAPSLPIDVAALGVDLLAVSAHKIYGPQGVGALWVREGVDLLPVSTGGGQERDLRAGTHNVAGIVGMGRAAALARAEGPARRAHLAALREVLWEAVAAVGDVVRTIPADGATAGTLHVRALGAPSDSVLIGLDALGVAVSAGSACSAGAVRPSPVLLAMGVGDDEARTGIRLTLGKDTSEADVARAGEAFVAVVRRVRAARRARAAS